MDKIAEFMSRIDVMKPNAINKDNIKQAVKLDSLLDSPEYAIEDKIDGCHYTMVAYRFFSQEKVEKTNNFGHLRDFFLKLAMSNIILDGEINYPGKTSQYCVHVTGADPGQAERFQISNGYIHYTIFDILRTSKGTWLINQPYAERRRVLEYFYNTYVKGTPYEHFIHLTHSIVENKRQFIDNIFAANGEGGVLKRLNSIYVMGKDPMWQWMKMKKGDEADLVVIGFDPATVEYKGNNMEGHPYWKEINGVTIPVTKYHYYGWIGAIVFGAYVDGKMKRICSASGMNESVRRDVSENQEKYLDKVARVTFMERTEDGYPRHPTFKNMHEDKTPNQCTWEF